MDRQAYLKELSDHLEGKCSHAQKRDILADYTEFFSNGAQEGKSEAELAAEFGPPEQAVRELLAGREKSSRFGGTVLRAAACLAVPAAYFAAAYLSLRGSGSFPVWAGVLFPLLLQAVLFLCKKDGGTKKPAVRHEKFAAVQTVLFGLCAVVLCVEGYAAVSAERIAEEADRAGGALPPLITLLPWAVWTAAAAVIVSGVLAFSAGRNGSRGARLILFGDTAVFTVLVNFTGTLMRISEPYYGGTAVGTDVLLAVLPNLAAAALFLAVQKAAEMRRARP